MPDAARSLAAKKAAATRARNKALGITSAPKAAKAPKAPKAPKPKKATPPKPARVVPVLTPQPRGQSWETIQLAPYQPYGRFNKRTPAEHEARQTEAVRRIEAKILRLYAAWRKHPTAKNKAALDEAVRVKERAVELEYKNRGLRYKAPETFQGKRRKAAERKRKVDKEATAKQLYGAARQEDRSFRARQLEQVAVERHHRGELSDAELAKVKRGVKRTQHADWLRLLRKEGLQKQRGSVKAPPK